MDTDNDNDKPQTEDQKELEAKARAAEPTARRNQPGRRPAEQPAPSSSSVRVTPPLAQPKPVTVTEYVVVEAATECLPLGLLDVPAPEFLHDVERVEAVATLASIYHLGYVMHVFTALDRALEQFRSGELRVASCRDELALHHLRRRGLVVTRAECASLVARHLGTRDGARPAGAYVDESVPKLWRRLLVELSHGGGLHWTRARALADALAAHWSQSVSDDTMMTVRDLRLQYDAATQILADLDDSGDPAGYWVSVQRFVGDDGLLLQWRAHAATQEVFRFVIDTARGNYPAVNVRDEGAPDDLATAAAVLSPEFASVLS